MPSMSVHRCPGCHEPGVPNSKFACRECWAELPEGVKGPILSTAKIPLTNERRWAAVQSAMDFYHENRTEP